MAEPPESTIDLFSDMFAIGRDEAITRLKANGNDLQRAAEDYLEDPTGQKYDMSWNESHFATDREGGASNAEFAFNIQGPDEHPPPLSYVNSAAPTRPPSRNPSPIGRPANATQEDADLAKAIRESAAESGIPPQEVGITGGQSYFGPANRAEYQSEQWAIVPVTAIDMKGSDPSPANRKRDIDAPVFLRQNEDNYVGALLTIYSKIPLVRNILLLCGSPPKSYGQHGEWWRGKPILPQDKLDRLAQGEQLWNEDERAEFVDELHRLIAFLENSDRSYGNADMLVGSEAVENSTQSWDALQRFIQALNNKCLTTENAAFEDIVTRGLIISVLPEEEPDNMDPEESMSTFTLLDFELSEEAYEWVDTIYDALDHLLWSSALSLEYSFPHDAKTAVLLKPAEVLTMRFSGCGLLKPCAIPLVFYADRYMEERKDLAIHFQTQIREIKKAMKKLDARTQARVTCKGTEGCAKFEGLSQNHPVEECCTKMIEYATKLHGRRKRDATWRVYQERWDEKIPYTMDDLRLIHTGQDGPIALIEEEELDLKRLDRIIGICNEKVEETRQVMIEHSKEQAMLQGVMDVIRKRLTCLESEADNELYVFKGDPEAYRPEYWNPTHKYFLRGVAISKDIAYVCVRNGPGSADVPDDGEPNDQWWKVGYVRSEASPIINKKVPASEVVAEAGAAKNPTVIYASEAAMQTKPIALSDALRMFVKTDNRSFKQELEFEPSTAETREMPPFEAPQTGITAANLASLDAKGVMRPKRKHSESSIATNGSIRDDFGDEPLTFDDNGPPSYLRDQVMTDASSPPSAKLSNIVDSLAKCHTDEEGAIIIEGIDPREQQTKDTNESSPETGNDARMPEMSERSRGMPAFLTQSSHRRPIDLMDLDAAAEQSSDQ